MATPKVSAATFRVWLLDERRTRWGWVLPLVLVPGILGTAIASSYWGQPLLGVLAGAGFALGTAAWYGRWILIAATVTSSPTQLTVVQTTSGSSQSLPFTQLAYCTYTTYRTRLLQIFCCDGTRLRLRARQGAADLDALAELLKSRLPGNAGR